ncbi:hypothetical protein ACFVXQ_13575 [Kitasatospora sp. NPDC058263]
MRATWMAAALTAAIALTPVATASATAAGNEAAALTPATSLPAFLADVPLPVGEPPVAAPPVSAPAPALPAAPDLAAATAAVPDPAAALGVLGGLGDVLKLVSGLLSAAVPSTGIPDLGVLQQLIATLDAATKDLLAQLPAAPAAAPVPVPAPLDQQPAADPPRTTTPALPPQALEDRLASLGAKAKALVDAATAAKPGQAAVQQAVTALAPDTVATTTGTVTRLTGP